jgi:aryl-alcohol dehydrogenase-like predicted oxidoreductase
VGVSEWSAQRIEEARRIQAELNLDPLVSNQPEYSMLQRRIEADVLPVCKRLGIGQVVWSPLAQGVLAGKYKPGEAPPSGTRAATPGDQDMMSRFMRDDVLEAVQNLRPIADDLGITMPQLALAWVLREPGISSAIVGATRPEQVDDNVAASGIELGDDVLERIDEILSGVLVSAVD